MIRMARLRPESKSRNGESGALNEEDQGIIREYIDKHFQYTTSNVALALIQDWDNQIGQFVKVMPGDFRNALAGRGISLADQIRDKSIVYQDITVDVTQG